jgi:hypothetical protein
MFELGPYQGSGPACIRRACRSFSQPGLEPARGHATVYTCPDYLTDGGEAAANRVESSPSRCPDRATPCVSCDQIVTQCGPPRRWAGEDSPIPRHPQNDREPHRVRQPVRPEDPAEPIEPLRLGPPPPI